MLPKANFIVLDLETGPADEKTIQAALDRWEPPSNVKDEAKIQARREEAAEKIKERSALLDAAPIAAVGVLPQPGGFAIFNGMPSKKEIKLSGFEVEISKSGSERQLLLDLRAWFDAVCVPDMTTVVGFNHLGFDLPKLRARFAAHRLRLPLILQPPLNGASGPPTVDVMRLFARWFSPERHDSPFVGLREVIERLGLPAYKDEIDGSEIPALVAQGKVKEVLSYLAVDVLATTAAFQLLTSTAEGLA